MNEGIIYIIVAVCILICLLAFVSGLCLGIHVGHDEVRELKEYLSFINWKKKHRKKAERK